MTAENLPDHPATLYVAARLPALSETFVYREFLGLRAQGRSMIGASVRKPVFMHGSDQVCSLADEVVIVYGVRTVVSLPLALIHHPFLALRALADAANADHRNLKGRLKHGFQALMGLSLGWRLRKRGIAHVHAHMAHVPAAIALYAARALGARFSFTGHAADLFVERAGLRFKLQQADFVASISRWHQDFYRDVARVDPGRTPLIRCSVAIPAEIFELGKEVVTVARLVPKKGIDLLVRAFAAADLPDWRLRIIGDGPERAELEGLAADFGLGDRICFGGSQPHAACLEAIAHAGIFVLPCRTAANGDKDGIPVVLMEAMAAARPVIGGDLPTIRELIADRTTGLLVEPDEERSLIAALREIASDPVLARRIGEQARAFIESEFSDAVNLDRLSAALDRTEGHYERAD